MRTQFPKAPQHEPEAKKLLYIEKAEARRVQVKYGVHHKDWHKRSREILRREVLDAYGGKCVCCSETRWQFLTIDHPDGKGKEDRAKHKKIHGQLYGWLKKKRYPKGYYRILCMNCNWVRRSGGGCPHDDEKAVMQ